MDSVGVVVLRGVWMWLRLDMRTVEYTNTRFMDMYTMLRRSSLLFLDKYITQSTDLFSCLYATRNNLSKQSVRFLSLIPF
jgi:hypothetical protein